MKKKIILFVVAVLLVLVVLCIVLLAMPAVPGEEVENTAATEGTSTLPVTAETAVTGEEGTSILISEDGQFTFTAGQFGERFTKTLPEGFSLEDPIAANASRNHKMQICILDVTGAATDMAILLDVKEEEQLCRQMALTIKSDAFEEDVTGMLKWYLTTFLYDVEAEELEEIYEDYLDMFITGAEEYRLHSGDSSSVMMSYGTEEDGNYYYVMISLQ